MKVENIDVKKTVERVKQFIAEDKTLSPSARSMFELLLIIVQLFIGKFSTNSKNSSKPPSQDPNRDKGTKDKNNIEKKKSGGQNGHTGNFLKPVSNPDKIEDIKHDKKLLPKGEYTQVGFEARQVIDIQIKKVVTEYRAEILTNQKGKSFTAPFPEGVTQRVQYGKSIKSHAVYMSQFQLIPYARVESYFKTQMHVELSSGSLFNFNKEAYDRLELFEEIVKKKLIDSELIHADETGINVGGKRLWLHNASNDLWVHFYPHKKRGTEAMDEIGILPNFKGVLSHDHWKSYYTYKECKHSLCNAHHIRELQHARDVYNLNWAKSIQELLIKINEEKIKTGDKLTKEVADNYRKQYRQILKDGESESPLPPQPLLLIEGTKKRGKIKKEKHRNLLERLQNFEDDVLRFMETDFVPFTNNLGENDIRMTKVHQKISGCFRSEEGAKIFCRIRSYLLTSQKHGVSPSEALTLLFDRKLPEFCGIDSGMAE